MKIVDLWSDTLTKPTQEMREAVLKLMMIFCEDSTVKVLQETTVKMVGMEDALFVCSRTMGNLIGNRYSTLYVYISTFICITSFVNFIHLKK